MIDEGSPLAAAFFVFESSSVHVGGVVRDFGWRLQPSVVARARRWTRLRI